MKQTMRLFIIGLFLTAVNAYAASGDLIVDGKLGVGTTNPGAKLDVINGGPGSPATVRIDARYNSSGPGLKVLANTRTGSDSLVEVDNYLGNPNFIILSNGNVGIGTTSPGMKLDVQGGYIRAQDSGANSGAFMEGANGVSYFGNIGTNDISFGNSNNYRYVTIQNGGNVGIGTTSPTSLLSIYGTNSSRVMLMNNTSGNVNTDSPKLSFWGNAGSESSIAGPSIQKINKTGYGRGRLAFFQHGGADYTSETEVMSIDYNGNVGIGTTSPSGKLEIMNLQTGAYANNVLLVLSDIFNNGSNGQHLYVNGYGSGGFMNGINFTNDWEQLSFGSSNNGTKLKHDLVISNGNVGIGTDTSAPNAKLQVKGSISIGSSASQANKALCWTSASIIGYCSSAIDANGGCTCNAIN